MAIIEHPVPYAYDGKEFEGMLVYDDGVSGKRPAIFMQPDWLGVCTHTVEMATEALGDADFVMMVADMFGMPVKIPDFLEEASQLGFTDLAPLRAWGEQTGYVVP